MAAWIGCGRKWKSICSNGPPRRDPQRLSRHVYGGQAHFSGCLAGAEERALDDFAGWEMED